MSTKHSWWAFCKSLLINCKPVQVVSQEPGADSEPNLFSCTGLLQEIESVTIQWTSLQKYEEYNPMKA